MNTKISLFSKPNERTRTEPMGISFGSIFSRKKTVKKHAIVRLKKNPEEISNNERIEGFLNDGSSLDE